MTSAAAGPYPAVIFDLDGTLVDSAKGIAAALDVVRARRGLGPVAVDDVRGWVSLGAGELVTRALGATPDSVGADLLAFREAYAKVPVNPDDLYPGALDVLRTLHARGFRLGICTNKPQALADNIVEGLGFGAFVSVVVGGSPDIRPKPDPQSLHRVMDRLQTGPAACLYVGDSEVDADTAKSASVPFVLIAHGYAIGPRDQIECVSVVENLGDLLPLTGAPPKGDGLQARLLALVVRFETLWRYYGVGVINTVFGYGAFAALIWLHLNVFAAQIIAHVAGATFNYFMFKRLVFINSRPAVMRYIGSYAANYLVGLAFLAAIRSAVPSPYIDGLLTIVVISAVNYLVLKLFVFRPGSATK